MTDQELKETIERLKLQIQFCAGEMKQLNALKRHIRWELQGKYKHLGSMQKKLDERESELKWREMRKPAPNESEVANGKFSRGLAAHAEMLYWWHNYQLVKDGKPHLPPLTPEQKLQRAMDRAKKIRRENDNVYFLSD